MQIQTSALQRNTLDQASLSCDNYLGRKKLEINRRMTLLQHKRSCLERELKAINTALRSLSKQL